MYHKLSRSDGQRSRSQLYLTYQHQSRYISRAHRLTEFKTLCELYHSIAERVTHVQGHKIKYSNCNNSAADCSISLKFRTEFRVIATLTQWPSCGNLTRRPWRYTACAIWTSYAKVFEKVIIWQTDIHTDRHDKNFINRAASRVVKDYWRPGHELHHAPCLLYC